MARSRLANPSIYQINDILRLRSSYASELHKFLGLIHLPVIISE